MDASTATAPTDRIDVFWDSGMLNHNSGNGVFYTGMDPGFLDVLEKHPENSDRVKNMVSILKRGPISPYISWLPGRPALLSELLSFHSSGIWIHFESICLLFQLLIALLLELLPFLSPATLVHFGLAIFL